MGRKTNPVIEALQAERLAEQARQAQDAILTDEIESGRAWSDGRVIYRDAPLYENDQPMQGIRQEIERLDRLVDEATARLKFAGTPDARHGAERRIASLEQELRTRREELWFWEENGREFGALQPCRNPECTNVIDARWNDGFSWCASCYAVATGATRPRT